jgi:hypothetical protein
MLTASPTLHSITDADECVFSSARLRGYHEPIVRKYDSSVRRKTRRPAVAVDLQQLIVPVTYRRGNQGKDLQQMNDLAS